MLSANRKISHQRSNKQVQSSSSLSKISTSHRFVLASTALVATTFASLPTVDALRTVQQSNLEEVLAKKKEDEVFASMENKKDSSNVVSPEPKGYLVALTKPKTDDMTKMEAALPKDFPLIRDLMSNSGIQDDGEALPSLKDVGPTTQEKKNNLRSKYLQAKRYADHLLHQHQLRQLEDAMEYCNGTKACLNSDPFCIKEGSCNDYQACSKSPGIQVEPESCNSRTACALSPGIIVGSESCNAESSCIRSPGACIGQRSCDDREACSDSTGIQVSTEACNDIQDCAQSPGALIDQQSCCSGDDKACYRSPNIIVDQFSCNDGGACAHSAKATIGKYACNCFRCCRFLEPNCTIPDFECNGGPFDCSFGPSGTLGCPEFN